MTSDKSELVLLPVFSWFDWRTGFFKNRLLFHRLESQYRARSYITIRFMFWFTSAAQQACSRCIGATQTDQSIGKQHTEAPQERSKSIKSSLLSSRSRSTPMPKQTINNGRCCMSIDGVEKGDGRTAHLWGIWLLSGIMS